MGKGLEKFKAEAKAIIEKEKDENKRKYLETTYGKIMTHIESVCDEEYDALLAQEHKSVERMWKFVNDKARKLAINGVACIDAGHDGTERIAAQVLKEMIEKASGGAVSCTPFYDRTARRFAV